MSIAEAPAKPLVESAELERQPESVIKLLLERVDRGYRRGYDENGNKLDDDGHKIGLAFDPGGLAGVVSQAMAKGLAETQILDCVDSFYGLSAGGLNALYTAAGQYQSGIDCYVDFMPQNGLVSPAEVFPPKLPKMDLEVVRHAIYEQRRINVEKIVGERIPVVVGATDLTQPLGRRVMFKSTDLGVGNATKILDQAMAGCLIPKVAGKYFELDGRKYADGTMAWSNSIELAKADGCTDVLSLANLAFDPKEPAAAIKSANFLITQIGDRYLDKNSPKLPPVYQGPTLKEWFRHPLKSLEQRLLDFITGESSGWYWNVQKYSDVVERKEAMATKFADRIFVDDSVNVERIYPPDISELPELLTMDKKRLKIGEKAGELAAKFALGSIGSKGHYERILKPQTEVA